MYKLSSYLCFGPGNEPTVEKCSIFGSGWFCLECSEQGFFSPENLNSAGWVFGQSGQTSGLGNQFCAHLEKWDITRLIKKSKLLKISEL